MYLQQQKLVWSVRLYKKVGSAEHIYNSRNQCGLLDRIKETSISSVSTIVEISVVCQTVSTTLQLHTLSTIVEISVVCQTYWLHSISGSNIYNSRNQCGLLDLLSMPMRRTLSTIVEISVVCQTRVERHEIIGCIYNSRNQCGLLDSAVHHTKEQHLQQQKLVWSVRPDRRNQQCLFLSTIVEISVVCQTPCFMQC